MSSRRRGLFGALLLVIALGALLAAAEALRGGPMWRSAYPYLPRRVQALPYQLRARLPAEAATPVALPSPVLPAADVVVTPASARPTTRPSVEPTREPAPLALASPEDAAPSPAAPSAPSALPTATLPESIQLEGLRHEYQTWNNCGPATISMALSFFGATPGQADAARVLKPDPDDKNVGPEELARFARQRGLDTRLRVGGRIEDLQAILASGLPVLVETWFVPEPGDEMGHYLLLTGYEGGVDDPAGRFLAADSYHGPRVELPYAEFDALWRVFNRLYLVTAPAERLRQAEALPGLGPADEAMWLGAAARAHAEIERDASDAFAWFNQGSSLLALGDAASAAASFDRARALGLPWRMLWYQHGPFEAYADLGRWQDVSALARANLANAPNLEESQYWLGRALEAAGDLEAARAAYREALRFQPGYAAAREALEAIDGATGDRGRSDR